MGGDEGQGAALGGNCDARTPEAGWRVGGERRAPGRGDRRDPRQGDGGCRAKQKSTHRAPLPLHSPFLACHLGTGRETHCAAEAARGLWGQQVPRPALASSSQLCGVA